MSEVQVTSLAGALSLILFFSSLMYIGGRHSAAALLVVATVVVSISTRAIVAFNATAFDNYDGMIYLVVDSMLAIPFCFSAWIPYLVKAGLSDTYISSMESDSVGLLKESFTIDDLSDLFKGDDVQLPDKPTRPSRRGRVTVFYEGIFLLVSLVFWPTSIITLVAFGSPDFMSDTPFSDFGSGNTSGKIVLAILFSISCLSTIGVYRGDRDARDGPLYAKSLAAYHEDMDNYIAMNNVYYELNAKKLEAMKSQISIPDEDD
jgi:hypothetical protein